MAESRYSKTISKLRWASGKAMESIRSLTGSSNDSDLAIYSRLTSNEFKMLGDKYGQDSLIAYIKNMEAKKVRANAT